MPDTPKISTALSDRYVIKHELGAGGMAIVYLAHDQKLDRDVALKVLRPELGAVLGSERFLTEIKISARLDHPHILTLIDSGDADGTLYYVLPYVRGESLRNKLVRERQLPLGEAIAITRQVASALDYAHRQGLVHRDIKPENIMIQEGEAMLTDFGIALAVTEAGGNRLTQTGLSLGTPQYMSPEQATGDRGIDGRSDVYSLASVLYEMLAGEPPVTGSTAQAMIAKLMTETPIRVRVLRDTVPESIDAALAKALAKTPADRFATADEFARALDITASQAQASVPRAAGRRMAVWGVAAALVLAVGAFALRGMGHSSARASLGRKTQLTVFGGVLTPAIAPDGKQLAYSTRHCGAGGCAFDVVEQDVGGTTTRAILQGATAAYGLEWSPDRRNLVFIGTVDHRYGSFLLSALGGPPRFLTSGSATFYAGGDSLLVGPTTHPDTVNWIRVTGLDGGVRDSIRVAGVGQGLAAISSVPGTQWIVTLVLQQPHGLWQVIDRSGKVADQVVNACTCGGIATRDAVWLDRIAGAAGEAVVRIALDRNNGHLASRQDTMVIGRFTGVTLTADGSQMVMDEGTLDFSVWATSFADVLAGRLPNERRVAESSNRLSADISPDGARLLFGRAVPTGAGHTDVRFGVTPFSGTPETPITAPGHVLSAWWTDSVTVGVRSRTPTGVELAEEDVRTGARRNILDLPDSTLRGAVPLPDGWAWIPVSADRIRVRQGGQTREIREPAWYGFIGEVIADSSGGRLFFAGFNAATGDSLGVSALTLSDGSTTQWVSMPSETGSISLLPGGALFLVAYPSEESLAFYKLTGPGQIQRLGNPPRPLNGVTVSDDLKRATAMARDYRADAWMYDVVRY